MRPFFPFYGSKWNMARYYPKPRAGLVVEPFAGAAGYSTFYDAECVQLVDADPIIVSVWRWLLSATPDDVMALPDLPNVGDSVDDHPLAPGAAALIGFWLNRGSASPKKSRTAFSARTDKAQLNWSPRAKERIAAQLPRLAGWTITLADFEFLGAVDGATVFIDPPYVEKGKYYRVSFNDYPRLARWCLELGQLANKVIVCENAGATWLPFSPLGSFKSTRGRSEEVAWIAGR